MYKNCIRLFAISLSLISLSAQSTEFLVKASPYAGIDAQWLHLGYRKGYGDNLFRKNIPQGNLYTGLRLNEHFGIELGYTSTLNMNKYVVLNPGDAGLGFTVAAGDPSEGTQFKSKFRGWHANFMLYSSPLLKDQSLQAFAGIGFSHKRLVLVEAPIAEDGIPMPLEIRNEARRSFAERKSLLRLSTGLQKMLNETWGCRLSAHWENTGKLSQLKPKENVNGITTAHAKDSISFGIGIFARL